MENNFIHESVVYQLLSKNGIKVPKFHSIKKESDVDAAPFKDGEPVVVKGLAQNLWHKSDEGALHFIAFNKAEIKSLDKKMRDQLALKYPWIETMVCTKANFKSSSGLPSEGYISIQKEDACGTVISFGVGGIHAEAWAMELDSNVLMWSPELSTPKDALKEISSHWLGKVWLGELRQGKKLTDSEKLLSFLKGIWDIALKIDELNISLLEMNPVVIDEDGHPIALDGVGTYKMEEEILPPRTTVLPASILAPKKVAIAGVSEKAGSFGRRILENLIQSEIPKKDILVIKPNSDEFLGVKCYPDLSILKTDPVDILILTLPAAITVKTLVDLMEQGSGAEIVYLVAGGIGDGGDTTGLAAQVHELLDSRRKKGLWTPSLIGPNSLGIVLAPLKLSTLFIAPEKLPIDFHASGNLAFISQSGAFFITRFSKEERLPVKYGLCIGNQMDLKASDILSVMESDKDIKVIGCYLEGFSKEEALRFAKSSKKLIGSGRHVVLYKGGRSEEGMKAAAGHTGAMAGNYELQKKILQKSGIYITENFLEFSSILNFLSAYPNFSGAKKIAVISNAGFETVASADHLGSNKKEKRENKIMPLSDSLKSELQAVFLKNGLAGLIGAANPLDLTPMADINAYLESTEVFAKSEAHAVVFCAVPLTDKLETFDIVTINEHAHKLKVIADVHKKPILVVVDSGHLYNNYREAYKKAGLPTFNSVEEAFVALRYERPILK